MKLFLLACLAIGAYSQYASVTFMHFKDPDCKIEDHNVTEPVGKCNLHGKAHFQLSVSADGTNVTEKEYSDDACTTEIGRPHSRKANVCTKVPGARGSHMIKANAAHTGALPEEAVGPALYRQKVTAAIKEFEGNFNYSNLGIVGGTVVRAPNPYPYTAGMRDTATGNSFCGGMLISPTYVLSAAHCADGSPIPFIAVNTLNRGGSATTRSVAQSIVHPNYRPQSLTHDFILLRLSSAVTDVQPVALDSGSDSNVGQMATVMGWGATSENGPVSPVLLEVDVAVVSNQQCNSAVGGIDSSMICAGGVAGRDACQGDSGGPLINTRSGALIGDVSFGIGCARAGLPGVYGRVSAVRSWIDGIVDNVEWV